MFSAPITEKLGPNKNPQPATERLATDPVKNMQTPEVAEILGYVQEQRSFQATLAFLDSLAHINQRPGSHRLG